MYTLKTDSWHDVNFIVTVDIASCHNDKLWSWQLPDFSDVISWKNASFSLAEIMDYNA